MANRQQSEKEIRRKQQNPNEAVGDEVERQSERGPKRPQPDADRGAQQIRKGK